MNQFDRSATPPFHKVLGTWVQSHTIESLQELTARAIRLREKVVIGHHNLNSVRLFHRDPLMRRFYETCDGIHIDGMPLVWWGRLIGHPLRPRHRVTYVDWVPTLMHDAAHSEWRVFYLGSRPNVAEAAASRLRQAHAGLQLRTRHGYFDIADPSTNRAVIDEIGAFQTNILMVGMGMPRQEHWVLSQRQVIPANVVLVSGAAFDYVSGVIPTPPRWMGGVSLEWLFRLVSEPKRLSKRYLIDPWQLLPWMVKDVRERLRASQPEPRRDSQEGGGTGEHP